MAYSIGIDIGGTNTRIAIVGEDNKIIHKEQIKTKDNVSFPNVISEKIISMLLEHKIPKNSIHAIGAGIPSITENGIVYDTTNIKSWKSLDLKGMLEKNTGITTYVENDAKCFALGELICGKLKGAKNAVAIILGTGVGSGIIINGDLYAGMMSSAGEIGKNALFDKTVEDYCSGTFFKTYGHSGEELFNLARKKSKTAKKVFEKYGSNLGLALVDVINILSPERVVLGGSIAKCYPYFGKSMKSVVQKKMHFKRLFKNISFVVTNNMDSAIIGAAALSKIRSV
jgi:glucokinase